MVFTREDERRRDELRQRLQPRRASGTLVNVVPSSTMGRRDKARTATSSPISSGAESPIPSVNFGLSIAEEQELALLDASYSEFIEEGLARMQTLARTVGAPSQGPANRILAGLRGFGGKVKAVIANRGSGTQQGLGPNRRPYRTIAMALPPLVIFMLCASDVSASQSISNNASNSTHTDGTESSPVTGHGQATIVHTFISLAALVGVLLFRLGFCRRLTAIPTISSQSSQQQYSALYYFFKLNLPFIYFSTIAVVGLLAAWSYGQLACSTEARPLNHSGDIPDGQFGASVASSPLASCYFVNTLCLLDVCLSIASIAVLTEGSTSQSMGEDSAPLIPL